MFVWDLVLLFCYVSIVSRISYQPILVTSIAEYVSFPPIFCLFFVLQKNLEMMVFEYFLTSVDNLNLAAGQLISIQLK